MTTATSLRPREFTVSENTSSKEFYEQLSSLNTSNSSDQSVPVRAYKGDSKGTTRIKIYEKKTEITHKFKAAANPQRVSARILVIKTIEKILAKESANCSSEKEKKEITQALTNIRARKSDCNHHDVRIPELITDLQPLQALWGKSNTTTQEKMSPAPSAMDATLSQRNEPTKKSDAPKTTTLKNTTSKLAKEINNKQKKTPSSDKTKDSALIRNQKTPSLKITKEAFDLSTAINFLEGVKKYNDSFNSESGSKASLRAGLKKTGEFSFYVSKNDDAKSKTNSRKAEGREAENKNTTTKRAIAMIQTLANSLVVQNRLSADEVKSVFSPIEKQKFIGMNDISLLLDLLEKGRRAAMPNNTATTTAADANPVTPQIINFNTNPFDVTPTELSTPKAASALAPTASAISFKEITTPENQPSATSKSITNTNPFEDVPTTENATTAPPAPPNFFQRVSNFFKPVTNFFASVRRFFGFN